MTIYFYVCIGLFVISFWGLGYYTLNTQNSILRERKKNRPKKIYLQKKIEIIEDNINKIQKEMEEIREEIKQYQTLTSQILEANKE